MSDEVQEMLTLPAFEQAAHKVREVTQETKLIESPHFSEIAGNRVFFKPENMQRTGAYKVRGAYYKISTLSDDERKRGLITASAGNHAQGVAYAAQRYGVPATIVMPATTPPKRSALRSCSQATCTTRPTPARSSWPRSAASPSCTPSTTWVSRLGKAPLRWKSCRSYRLSTTSWSPSEAAGLPRAYRPWPSS